VSRKCCLTNLAFELIPLERADESFLRHFRVPLSLRCGAGRGVAKNIDSHLGRRSMYDDDGTMVEGAGFGGSNRKGKRGGGEMERGPCV